jgi:DNA-binding IclR family transcriptional regulator
MVLETLCNEENIPILDLIRKKEKTSLADLYLQTGTDPGKLETQLEALCTTGCVVQEMAPIGTHYRLNPERILQINGISRRINQIRESGLREQTG